MLKRIPAPRAQELLADAASVSTADPAVSYPSWYIHRWHFLPEGYLSRRSAALYEHVIRNLYNQGLEGRTVRTVLEQLRRLNPASLLEVGCGPGRLLAAASQSGIAHDRVGLDLSPFLLERAHARLRGNLARLVHGDGLAIPSEESAFDAALSCHYLGHLPSAIREEALAEMTRVVRPGGHVVVVEHRWHHWPGNQALRLVRTSLQNFGLIRVSIFERLDLPAKVVLV